MPEIVRRERRDPHRSTAARDRGPQAVRSRLREESLVRIAILPRRERRLDRIREDVWKLHPERSPLLLRRSPKPDATRRLVVVADAEMLDRFETRSTPVEPQKRETMNARENAEHCLDVSGGRRLRLDLLFVGEADPRARGIRIDLRVVQDDRERLDRLPDRRGLPSLLAQREDGLVQVLLRDLVHATISQEREETIESDAMKDARRVAHVHARGLPALDCFRERRSALGLTEDRKVRDTASWG